MELPVTVPRVGIFGFFGETTAFHDAILEAEYRWMAYYEGYGFLDDIGNLDKFFLPETRAFVNEMNRTGPWTPVPLLYAVSESGPQLSESHFHNLMAKANELLAKAGPLDGIYISGHGSVVAEETLDTDAVLLKLIRKHVGPQTPIIETLDLHGKLTTAMLETGDLFISYQTDPHIDMAERGAEAARAMRRLLAGERPAVAYVRLPMMISGTGIVTAGSPFRESVSRAKAILGSSGNVSILPSYELSDTPFAGFHVLVSSWTSLDEAEQLCRDTAAFLWDRSHGFISTSLSLPAFAKLAYDIGRTPTLPPTCFADAADNPGGGGTGSTMTALEALLHIGANSAAIGPIHDPAVASAAAAAGEGAIIQVTFNADLDDPYAKPFTVKARVTRIADGKFGIRCASPDIGRMDQGLTVGLEVQGVTVVVCSRRLQALAVEQFEIAGVDFTKIRSVVVKSRAHYQVSFSEFFDRNQMYTIEGCGWTNESFGQWQYRRIRPPLFPHFGEASWSPDAPCHFVRPAGHRGRA